MSRNTSIGIESDFLKIILHALSYLLEYEHGTSITRTMESDGETMTETKQRDPPRNILELLKCLGPGIIMAATIVGAGELVATTSTGGRAGMTLLWLIIIGSVLKYWMQVSSQDNYVAHGQCVQNSYICADRWKSLEVLLCGDSQR